MRLIIVISVTILSCLSVQAGPAQDSRQGFPPSAAEAPPLAAEFEARMAVRPGRPAEKTHWYLLREPNRIETGRPRGGVAEIWERDARGEISLRRVFHADRRVVEYTAGELKARRLQPSWTTLGSVLDPQTFVSFKRTGTRRVRGGNAVVYQGKRNGERVEVWWLENLSLPARLEQQGAAGRFTLTLQALHTPIPPGWPRVDAADLQDYLPMDAADFGDMEYDPFVRKVQQLDAERRRLGRTGHHVGHAH